MSVKFSEQPHIDSSPTYVVESQKSLRDLGLTDVYRYRELLYFLVWRDIKVRYKQTAIGFGWAVIQPVTTMVIFTIIFGNFAGIPSDDVPYPIFAYAALLPWTYFSTSLSRAGNSVVAESGIISKVYFPRLIAPISASLAPLVDFLLALTVAFGLMVWYGIVPSWHVVSLPIFIFIAMLTSLSVSLWLSSLNVWYRDVRHALPFFVQVWMYASPIIYPVSIIPEKWRFLYGLNPIVGVIDGFRWALLGTGSPDLNVMVASIIGMLLMLFGGLIYFSRTERSFADII